MPSKLRPSLVVLAALAAPIALAAPARAEEPAAAAPAKPPVVSVVAATEGEVVSTVIVTGTLIAREEIQVAADVDGLRVEEILADEGDTVAAGAVLARLATDQLDISLAQNTAELASADAAIAQARSQIAEARASAVQAAAALERTRTLTGRGVASQDTLDQRVATADAANARVAAAEQGLAAAEAARAVTEAQRRTLELSRSKTEVRTPKGGLVLARAARIGAVVSSQSGALFRLAENGEIELDADVTDAVLARMRAGQGVAVLPAGADAPVAGTIRLVAPEVNATTRLGKVRVSLPASPVLRVGAFARGTVELARTRGVVLPAGAVLTSADTVAVQVVKDGKVETRPVVTGLAGGGLVEIVSGLAAGEDVVARSGTFLRDGDAVAPVRAAAEGAKG